MPIGVGSQQISGSIGGVAINNEAVGIWNFHLYNGMHPAPAIKPRSNIESINNMWKFRGIDSYLRVGTDYFTQDSLNEDKNFIVQFKIQTNQPDSLLFLTGQDINQFFALELRGGQFVLSTNFNFTQGMIQKTITDYKNVTEMSSPTVVKAGILTKSKIVAIMLNNKYFI